MGFTWFLCSLNLLVGFFNGAGPVLTMASIKVRPSSNFWVNEGEPLNFTCHTKEQEEVPFCTITLSVSGTAQSWTFTSSRLVYNVSGDRYWGAGLDKGDCGISIARANASRHHGKFACKTPGKSGQDDETTVVVNVAKAPQPLEMSGLPDMPLQEETTLNVTCSVRRGRPAAHLAWSLGGSPLLWGLSELHNTSDVEDTTSVSQTLSHVVTWRDHGHNLTCLATHPTYKSAAVEQSTLILVQFAPRLIPGENNGTSLMSGTQQVEVQVGERATLHARVFANPAPHITWSHAGSNIAETESADLPYWAQEASCSELGYCRTTLTIRNVTEEHLEQTFVITAGNQLGEITINYTLVNMKNNTGHTNGGSKQSASTKRDDIALVVSLVMAALVLTLVFLVMMAVRARRERLLSQQQRGAAAAEDKTTQTPDESQWSRRFTLSGMVRSLSLMRQRFSSQQQQLFGVKSRSVHEYVELELETGELVAPAGTVQAPTVSSGAPAGTVQAPTVSSEAPTGTVQAPTVSSGASAGTVQAPLDNPLRDSGISGSAAVPTCPANYAEPSDALNLQPGSAAANMKPAPYSTDEYAEVEQVFKTTSGVETTQTNSTLNPESSLLYAEVTKNSTVKNSEPPPVHNNPLEYAEIVKGKKSSSPSQSKWLKPLTPTCNSSDFYAEVNKEKKTSSDSQTKVSIPPNDTLKPQQNPESSLEYAVVDKSHSSAQKSAVTQQGNTPIAAEPYSSAEYAEVGDIFT